MQNLRQYQNILLYLTDGRVLRVTAPVFHDCDKPIAVRRIKLTQPADLPDDCQWPADAYDKLFVES